MGRQSNDSIMVGSSIALLQERFRQLERVREKREEQQLLKLFTEPEKMVSPSPSPTMRFEASRKLSFQPNKIFPLSPPADDLLSLGLRSPSKVSDFRATTNRSLTNLWPTSGMVASPSLTNGNSEVDTSLHL